MTMAVLSSGTTVPHATTVTHTGVTRIEVGTVELRALPARTLARALFLVDTIRAFERWLLDNASLVPGPLHSSIGQEAVAAGMGVTLRRTDALTSTHRAHHDVLAKLISWAAPDDFDPASVDAVPGEVRSLVLATLAEILGLRTGLCQGRGGSMHLAHAPSGIVTSAIVGGGIPGAVGQALAARLRGTGGVGVAAFGDGATPIGAFHEAASLARAWNLPVIFLLENNHYSVATTVRETAGFEDLSLRAAGYDMPALVVDGMDPAAVHVAMERARLHATTAGPILVEASTYRFYHQNGPLPGSAFKYRTRDEEQAWVALDPAITFPARLVGAGILSEADTGHIHALAASLIASCTDEVSVDTAVGRRVRPELYPVPELFQPALIGPGLPVVDPAVLDQSVPDGDAPPVTYAAAVAGVIARWLERDPDAFVLGEEVGHLGGGVAGLTKAALTVAPHRVLSTPICENGFTGAAFGAALAGMRPIVEFMYPDFTLEAADQLFNHIPRARFMYGEQHQVPLVVRTQISRGRGYGPQHSCDPAVQFALYPGWRVVSPSTPDDYVGLFNAAMLTRDPVLVIDDHRLMKLSAVLPRAGFDYVVTPGVARLARPGRDVTVVAWGHGLHRVLALGEGLASLGIEIEIIDPRWLDRASFDRATVLASVGRTGALVIVEDAMRSHSMGGLILDYLMPDLYALLRSAPRRVTGLDVYSPVSAPLEAHVHLQDSSILEAITAAAAVARTKG